MRKIKESLSIVTACFNEETSIEYTLKRWLNYFKTKVRMSKFEIIITDDGSNDKTVEIIEKIKKKNKQIRLFRFKNNLGASLAFNNSIRKARYDHILINDADNQFPIRNFVNMWDKLLLNNADVVIGSRNRLKEVTFLSLGSYISSKIMNFFYKSNIPDFNCSLKLIKLHKIKKVYLEAVGLNYSTEMTAKILEKNLNISSVNVTHNKNIKKKNIKKNLKNSIQRILFLIYLINRKLLIKCNVIKA